MGQDSIAQGGIWKSCDHRNLDPGHDIAPIDSESREAPDFPDTRLMRASR